jgi:putative two-component system response regulator
MTSEKGMEERPRVLVVDDHPENTELLEAFLVPQGYEVVTAATGEQALERLSSNDVALMLLDVMMPGIDGYEVIRRVRQDGKHRQLPIVLVTALRDTEERVKGIEAGCDDFLSKPVDKMELLTRVRSLLKVKAYNDLMSKYREDLESEVSSRTEELRHAIEGIRAASLETIVRLSRAAEYRDEDTGAHILRMSHYAAAVARRMGLPERDVETILHAAPMHDIGKIGIPDHILMKPAKLDAEEWEVMKSHAAIGARILAGSNADVIRLGETIAGTHHEKWNGEGYPMGLKGEGIPTSGRIAAIADVFDALTSKRPYKEPFSLDRSFSIIKEGRGAHFDPAVVDAFFEVEDEILQIKARYQDEGQGHLALRAETRQQAAE